LLQVFLNLSVLTDSTEALEFGQKKLTSFGKVPKYVEKLEVLSLKPTYLRTASNKQIFLYKADQGTDYMLRMF
jgi:hypothetical protein